MTQEEILQIFKDAGALLEGHFILSSGLHSPHYIEKFRVLEQPKFTEILCKEIAARFINEKITVVAGPMTGGIILAYETGKQLGAKAIFTERVDGKMKFRRGFIISPRDRVLIVEDVITTGRSVKEVLEEVKATGAHVVGIGCLVDRSNGKISFEVPVKALLTLDVTSYSPDICPLCKSGSTAVKPGSKGIL